MHQDSSFVILYFLMNKELFSIFKPIDYTCLFNISALPGTETHYVGCLELKIDLYMS